MPDGLTFEELLANLSLGSDSAPPVIPALPSPPRRTFRDSAAPSPARRTAVPPPLSPASSPHHAVRDAAAPWIQASPSSARRAGVSPSPVASHADPSLFPATSTLIYYFESRDGSGYTTDWATAGAASQGVPDGHVRVVQAGSKKKKPKAKAYTVFYGQVPGVYLAWAQAKDMVSRVPNAVYRGYPSVAEAQEAFDYARARGWVRASGHTIDLIPNMPPPSELDEVVNPFWTSAPNLRDDDEWYVVYRGITPGVYRTVCVCSAKTEISYSPNRISSGWRRN
ncbi:Cauli-VI domain-containing protein [Mycena sanguinolenta]|uniref:Cauli-VI domain-containing protein n=1 Tax=Mycena sanguinolenta TaxID=230812 RepID=A0A8H6X889_9AGAR|nr:Cauli-VI domain-containing protein [Mycena sanguinolenta]